MLHKLSAPTRPDIVIGVIEIWETWVSVCGKRGSETKDDDKGEEQETKGSNDDTKKHADETKKESKDKDVRKKGDLWR